MTRTTNVDPQDDAQRRLLARRLIARRKALGVSQRQLARQMGVSSSWVCEFEWMSAAGQNDPRLSTLLRYARAIGAQLILEIRPLDQPLDET